MLLLLPLLLLLANDDPPPDPPPVVVVGLVVEVEGGGAGEDAFARVLLEVDPFVGPNELDILRFVALSKRMLYEYKKL